MTNSAKEIANNAGLREVQNDLSTLKADAATTIRDAATFARNIKNESGTIIHDGVEYVRAASQNEFHKMEERVREKPGQSVALAFCAGLALATLLGSRR